MSTAWDVIIVGSGHAGVSAAWPLLEMGLQVLMVDGGNEPRVAPPAGSLMHTRQSDDEQWRWMVGDDLYALRNMAATSPKLRVPVHRHVFEGFERDNRIDAENYVAIGSMAPGGLSNAWGCGVARFSGSDLAAFPVTEEELAPSYEAVCRRMGVAGRASDDLSTYTGLDEWAADPVPLDVLHRTLFKRHNKRGPRASGFLLGHSRTAVIFQERDHRLGCNLCGSCLWGCQRRSLYSAADELAALKRHPNFQYRPGFVVQAIESSAEGAAVRGGHEERLMARKVLLGAGTLASTRLALQALGLGETTMKSCPMAVFLLWLPEFLGRRPEDTFALGQLSFVLPLMERARAFGSLFSTSGILVSEFARHLPLSTRHAIDFLRLFLPTCVVGNVFLPGRFSRAQLVLRSDGSLHVTGSHPSELTATMRAVQRGLRREFLALGGLLLPGSFSVGKPGSDIHYACSLPMVAEPRPGQTDRWGELRGLPNIHVIDGASLSDLPEKFHALTIMANADRIARRVSQEVGV